jgi:cytochrome oxidase Cu insertion factor (SCO1/SenC/PrrC family)
MEDRLTERLATRHWTTLVALAAILVITAAWWGLALWPLPSNAPAWIGRTRSVCFGTAGTGLPDAAGWMLLLGQPLMMALMLTAISGNTTLRESLAGVARSRGGRFVLRSATVLGIAAALGAGARVASGYGLVGSPGDAPAATLLAPDFRRLDRPAPALGLVDQRGDTVTLGRFHGRVLLVTFAYAHCETVCPLLVQEVLRARRQLGATSPAVLVVTVDPWRDVPSRLPAIAALWRLPEETWVAGGDVASVTAALDRWTVPHIRDPRTGAVTHPNLVYVVDREGRIAYAVTGDAAAIVQLVERL